MTLLPMLAAVAAATVAPLTPDSTVGALAAHPVLAPVAKRLMPWDDRPTDPGLPLSRVGELMPWHSHVSPEAIAGALNALAAEPTPFLEIWPDGDPRRGRAVLFFYRGKPGAPFALVCPGGGFAYVGTLHEGLPVAREIAKRGYNAFVLRYRVEAPMEDLAAALARIRAQAAALKVATEGFSLWGGSAGARMAWAGARLPGGKPAAIVMAYTGQRDWRADDPPTYAIVGARRHRPRPRRLRARRGAPRRRRADRMPRRPRRRSRLRPRERLSRGRLGGRGRRLLGTFPQ